MGYLRLNFQLPAIHDINSNIFKNLKQNKKSLRVPTKGLGGIPYMKRKKIQKIAMQGCFKTHTRFENSMFNPLARSVLARSVLARYDSTHYETRTLSSCTLKILEKSAECPLLCTVYMGAAT